MGAGGARLSGGRYERPFQSGEQLHSAIYRRRPDGLAAACRTHVLRNTSLGDGRIRLRGTGNLCARPRRNARTVQKPRVEDAQVMLPGEMHL
ncbi:Hypothetical protein XFF4834R_chr02590 [Xanthomonas citri pv. fuscans]|nr:Hypothetical protein XFF4834R_chr02590 [Xanthomonas citri pv. fuscans]